MIQKSALEKTIEDAAVAYAKKEYQCLVRKIQYVGRRGAPDRMFVFPNSEILFLEFKRPHGGVRHPSQVREVERLKGCGVRVAFVKTFESAKLLIQLSGDMKHADSF